MLSSRALVWVAAAVACLACVARAAAPSYAAGTPESLVMQRMARGLRARDNPRFAKFFGKGATGLPGDVRRNIVLAEHSSPPLESVENVFFGAAGQQGARYLGGIIRGFSNGVTGQPKRYKRSFKRRSFSARASLDGNSLPCRLKRLGWLPFERTWVGSAFDSAFTYGLPEQHKRALVKAFTEWILSKADANKLKIVYLAGASRGGALVARIAKELRRLPALKNTKIIVSLLDTVFNQKEGEGGATPTIIHHPLVSDTRRFCYAANFVDWFGGKTPNTFFYQIAGGSDVFGRLDDIVGNPRCFMVEEEELAAAAPFYRQKWVDAGHADIGRDLSLPHWDEQLQFFKRHLDGFSPKQED